MGGTSLSTLAFQLLSWQLFCVSVSEGVTVLQHIWDRFLHNACQCAFLSVLMVCRFVLQVAVLFKNHNDLLTQFTYFLPDNSPPQVRRHLKQYAWASCGMVHQPALQYTCSS